MPVGKLSEFDISNGNWSSYVDRLNMYYVVNEVKNELKLPTMIASMGDAAYELLVNLCSPKKPADLTFTEAVELMKQHLQPAPSALAERYLFRQRRQGASESVAIYVAELKRLSRHCKFNSLALSDNLRDQFVCGLRSELIRQRLFAENDDLIFNDAVKIASSLEAAERDAAAVHGNSGAGGADTAAAGGADTSAMHLLRQAGRGRGARAGGGGAGGQRRAGYAASSAGPRGSGLGPKCYACGSGSHLAGDCRFKEFVCSKCQRVGHLRRVCPEQRGGPRRGEERGRLHYGDVEDYQDAEGEEDQEDLEEYINHVCLSDYKAVSLPILIEKKVLNMEIDTGTAISCVSKLTYDKYFSHLNIHSDNTVLRFYDGSKIKPIGTINPTVSYKDVTKTLDLFVINGGMTSLLGRQWLSELGIQIPKFQCNFVNNKEIKMDTEISSLLSRFNSLFNGELGRYTGGKARLRVREGAEPAFHRARPLPYALRERVDAELDAMLSAGVIEPVDCSDWASPLVPINKADGSLRICADYKATLNPTLLIDRYPLPRIDDVLVGLKGAQYFSKIDLSQAYNQVELDETKKFTVINTHRGLFKYNRLVFGLSSSPGIFQRIMVNLFQGIPDVQVFLDDVLIGGRTKQRHLMALEAVLQRLLDSGMKLKRNKCVFLVEEVTYLGYVITKEGIKIDSSKVEAIQKIPRPQNITELRSFLGLINFFGKFVRNFSARLVPLYNLLRKEVEWNWDRECDKIFTEVKAILTGTEVLCHYDPDKPLIVTCDASARGVGAVLSQPGPRGERPVAYVSRTLNDAEKHYSQIHREALAIVFSVRKFHQYLYGRKFILRTDHKPLVSIFGPNKGIPQMAASRMLRWAVILSAYSYDIEYVKSEENSADGLSRLPINYSRAKIIPEQTFLHIAQEALYLDYNDIKKHTGKDPILSRVLGYNRDGWPSECDIIGLQPYFNRRAELYEELGCLMWGHRVVVPSSCRAKVVSIIHEPHLGIVKSKALARSYVWWPGVDEAVEAACRACGPCAAQQDAPPRAAPRSWPWPSRPWIRLHVDFLGPIFGRTYLVVIDAMSKWVEIFHVPSTAANSTIGKLEELWGRWGIPKQLVSDNGPPFTSHDFKRFLDKNRIEHIFTAPYHPASNGLAENAVRSLKKVIKKAVMEQKDVNTALNEYLLYYRNIEHSTTKECPALLLTGRRLRTRLDNLKPDRELGVRKAQARQIDSAGGVERRINPGDEVWYRQFLKGEKWGPGRVVDSVGSSDFKVMDEMDGNIYIGISISLGAGGGVPLHFPQSWSWKSQSKQSWGHLSSRPDGRHRQARVRHRARALVLRVQRSALRRRQTHRQRRQPYRPRECALSESVEYRQFLNIFRY